MILATGLRFLQQHRAELLPVTSRRVNGPMSDDAMGVIVIDYDSSVRATSRRARHEFFRGVQAALAGSIIPEASEDA